MAAAGSFKRPAAPAQHPPLRACPSRGPRGGGLGRSGSSSRVRTGLRLGGGGQKLGLTSEHLSSTRASPVTAPRVRWRATGGRRGGGGGGSSIRSRAAAAPPFVLRPRSPRGESLGESWGWGAEMGSGLGIWGGGRVGIQLWRGGGGGD